MPAPDRYLVVKPVVGNTYAAVAASAAFSDWVQVDDREVGSTSIDFDVQPTDPEFTGTEKVVESGSSSINDGPPPEDLYPYDLQRIATLVAQLEGGGMDAHSGGTFIARHAPWSFGHNPDDPDPEDNFGWYHVLSAQKGAESAVFAVDPTESRWQEAWRPAWPEGAIGYEVEQVEVASGQWGPYSEVQEIHYRAVIAPVVTRGQHYGGLYTRLLLAEEWGTTTTPRIVTSTSGGLHFEWESPGQAYPLFPNDGFRVAAVDLPLEGTLDPPEVYETSFPPTEDTRYIGAFGRYSVITCGTFGDANILVDGDGSGTFQAGPGVTDYNGVTYTIRPPRIRWIYDRVPYRRTYPRGDGVAGGAQRTWPPAKGVQSSNRTFGGYL